MPRVDFELNMPKSAYSVLIGESLAEFSGPLSSALSGRKALVLTDGGAEAALGALTALLDENGLAYALHLMGKGEGAKSFDSLLSVLDALLEGGFTKSDVIINLGGGVVGDLGGFAAAVYKRGMNYINMPTTLLSMIDSSVGGKTGVDLGGIKNAVGAFHQPSLVLCACANLKTLPERELRSGFGEVLKYFCISASPIMERSLREGGVTPALIEECCRVKRDFVQNDVHDTGARRILNLGHTFAHALEAASGFGILHGEAVCMGLYSEARFAVSLGLSSPAVPDRIAELASAAGLCCTLPKGIAKSACELLIHDKKNSSGNIEMAFISDFGKPFLHGVSVDTAAKFLASEGE